MVGEAIWTSADGLDITCGLPCTPYDESQAARCSTGQSPRSMEQGCGRRIRYRHRSTSGSARPGEGYPDILLVDAARARVYRPLTRKGWGSPSASAHRSRSRNGTCGSDYTTLLQVAFPALPDDLENVDVQLATVPPFWRVPVTPPGMLPLASYPTDLTRPADPTPVIASTQAVQLPTSRAALSRHGQCRLHQQQLHLDRLDDPVG